MAADPIPPLIRPAPADAVPAERLVVPGSGSLAFTVERGDSVTITDPEGLQPAVLQLSREGREAERSIVLGEGGDPGASYRFTAEGSFACLLEAPGAPMFPDAQDAPTELHVLIDRAAPRKGPPPPLAEPLLDLRVNAASAEAYRVKAGDYIQIIDVEGKQCSDFLAFDAAALDGGVEHGLDPAVTRTLMGSDFSRPGLHSRYFDAMLTPLVEVVRDTVGRHDTFLLACTAKYYEDMGYPGHFNCTDNFNAALGPHGVAPRRSWPAINFFYNTAVDGEGRITFDEPWSRPGDYVLLRALADIVCASSSCADDIDPANAWNPTDIHVRVYSGESQFTSGIMHRMTPDAPPRLTRETGFHPRTSALTRNFVDYHGFWLPTCYANEGPIAEYWACRERAVVMDLSPLRKFEVTGPDAEQLMQLALTRDVTRLAVGQIVYTAMCYETGGMVDDGTLFRLGPANFRWVCGDDYCGVWLRELAARYQLRAWVRSSIDQLHNMALQGPKSREILSALLVTPRHQPTAEELKWFRFTIGKIADIPVLVSRTGYTGELGYEIWCHPDRAAALWDAVMAGGEAHGILPCGLDALDMLRIEAGLAFGGYEFCDQTDPFEAGIGFTVPKAKQAPYVGAMALERRRESPQRRLVGLEVEGAEPVGHGDPVCQGRAQVGVITSATRSPVLGRTIALARVDTVFAEIGQALEVGKLDGYQKRIGAQVVRFPHYDPDKTRVRS